MYTVRAAREDELGKLAAVERSAAGLFEGTAHAYLCDAPLLSESSTLASQHELGAVWVAVDAAGEVAGFAVAGELGGEAYLYEIDVAKEHGRRGVGRQLVAAALGWARAAGYATMTLSTCVDVPWNAPFYAKLGFAPVAEADLTPAMVETRRHEAEAGFLMDRRVFMRRPLKLAD